ncbi:MAG TPA: hypothetical protein VH234_05015 [Candidatus Saccharimonadales bacterium]|jgi:hypothetical protein|nr:hypothetical protein [Candidatus Saccharimonadales bacterium]
MNRVAQIGAELLAAGAIGAGAGYANYEFTEQVTVPVIAGHVQKYERRSDERINRDASILGGLAVGGSSFVVIKRLRRRRNPVEEEPEDL